MEYDRQEIREKFNDLFEHSLDLIYVSDLKGNFLDANDIALIALGYEREEISQINFLNILEKDELEKAYGVLKEILKIGKQSKRREYKVMAKNGNFIHIETYAIPLKRDGEIYAVLGIGRNITDRKKTEQKLLDSGEMFRALYKEGPIAAYTWKKYNNDFVLIDYNNSAEILTNENVISFLGHKASNMYKDRQDILEDLHQCFNNKTNLTREMKYKFQFTEEKKYLLVNYGYVKPDLVIVQTEDITEKRVAEVKLRESEKKYRSILENMQDGYFEVDLNGNYTFVNDYHCKFLGYPKDELIGMNYRDIIEKKTINEVFKKFNQLYNGEILRAIFETKVFRNDGSMRIIDGTAYLKFDSKGKKVGFYGFTRDITEKVEAEQKLRKSELKYRNMINHLDVGFYQVTLDGILLTHNPAYNKILGFYISEDLKGTKVTDLWQHPELRAEYLEQMLKNEIVKGYVCHSFKKNGEKIVLELNSHLIRDEEKKPIRIDGTFIDITEKFLLERELKKSEEKYRSLFENMNAGFAYHEVIVDDNNKPIDYKYHEVNPAFEKLTGVKKENLIGKTVTEAIPGTENDPADWIGRFGNVGLTGIPLTIEEYSEAIKKWFKVSGYSPKKGYFAVTFWDITDRKRTEEKLKESEEKYRYLYENIPFSIVLINFKGEIIDCNLTTETMFGYKKTDLMGKKFQKISVIHADDLPNIMKLFKKFIKGERLHRIDLQMYRKDRSLIWVNLQASLIQIEKEYFVQALFTDITKRKQAEFLINEEITKLKELDQIRKNLISRVAHELKTPLATVCGGAELFSILYDKKLEGEQLELIKLIEKGGKRLKYLVDNLIDISRIEYDKFKLKKQKCDLSEVIIESSKEMVHFVKDRNLTLNLELLEELYLDIDKIRIEQVILNLLSNAIKNTRPKGKINIKLEKFDNWAIISVNDTGIGLTREEMEILFTRFGKIERFGDGLEYIDIQGSGLGLFISKEIVDLHGGNIRAESQGRNKGSTFIVKLPIY